ncbi:MAG TPA: nucleotidyltransferase domain-containing protein [Opitutaceae bacterium]|nr:nucleotidyltransferase domain-containing protein [Opitutaceae bacterium]
MPDRTPIALLASRREELAALCRRFAVERLDVFGSASRGDFVAGASDIDLLVRFAEAGGPGYADRYLEFAEALERALGCPVDLLTERSLRNPHLIEQIEKDRLNLYAA